MPSLLDDEDLFEAMTLGGISSPNGVSFSGHDRDIGWEVKRGNAQAGATTTRTSEDPIEFDATFALADDDDEERFEAFLSIAKSTISGAKPKAIDCYHPELAEVGINAVVLRKIYGSTRDGKGGRVRKLRFLEYRPPKAKGGTPKGSSSSARTKREDLDPNAKALAELAALTKKYQDTPWG